MVKIQHGSDTLLVTMGAFQNTYKKLGYEIVEDKKPKKKEYVKPTIEKAEEPAELDYDYLLEKPISSWSKEELKEFADAKGIDTSKATKVAEVKDIIKTWLELNA